MDVKLIQYAYNDNGKNIIVDETKAPFDGEKYLLINHNGDGCIGYWVKLEYKPSNYFDDDYDGFCWCNDDGVMMMVNVLNWMISYIMLKFLVLKK